MFRTKMKEEGKDVAELLAKYALAKEHAKRDRRPVSPLRAALEDGRSPVKTVSQVRALQEQLSPFRHERLQKSRLTMRPDMKDFSDAHVAVLHYGQESDHD